MYGRPLPPRNAQCKEGWTNGIGIFALLIFASAALSAPRWIQPMLMNADCSACPGPGYRDKLM